MYGNIIRKCLLTLRMFYNSVNILIYVGQNFNFVQKEILY